MYQKKENDFFFIADFGRAGFQTKVSEMAYNLFPLQSKYCLGLEAYFIKYSTLQLLGVSWRFVWW